MTATDKLGSGGVGDLIRALRRRRQELGLSQEEVGLRIGVCDNLVAKWETGHRRASPHLVWCWAEALGCELQLTAVRDVAPQSGMRHQVERRLPGETGAAHPTRSCHTYIRGDAPANRYEP